MSTEWLPPVPAGDPAPAPVPAPAASPREPRSLLQRFWGYVLMVGAAVLKFGKAALLLLPKAKVLTTSGTMLVSIAAYSFIWGWPFAACFVVLLLVHEMGHVIQLRREGIPASAPMFIPFLGAAVSAKSLGDDATAEARVGLAGPVLGTLGTVALIPLVVLSDNDFWSALAFTGFFLNLFNLLPVVPLDGGRAMAALSPRMWFVGLFGVAVLVFAYPNPVIVLILLLAGFETYRRWKARKAGGEEAASYYNVSSRHRVIIGAVYLALIVVCALGMDLTHVARDFGDV